MREPDYSAVLDSNERERMLREGYLPEVIDYHARERYHKLQEDFRWKDAILKSHYNGVPYYDFVADVFPDVDKLMVVTADVGYREMDVDELLEYHADRDDVYVPPATFINGYYTAGTCRDLYALVVDIDRVRPETLQAVIENGNVGSMIPLPTYIVNSGRGVHFYYVFDNPVPYYHVNRDTLKTMYGKLCGITRQNILADTDWHAITQPFRLPGSRTRLDQAVTAWQSGDKWNPRVFAHRLGVDASELDLQRRPLVSQKEYHENKESGETAERPKKKKATQKMSTWKSALEGNVGFYNYCLARCYEETKQGSRYRSMCGLVIVAYKVGTISKEQIEKDLMQLLIHYNKIGNYMKPSEVKKALRMYNSQALRTRSTTLESYFGWKFDRDAWKRREARKAKGRERTKEEVWKIARVTRDILFPNGEWRNKSGSPTKEDEIRAWREDNPDGTPRECIEDTGISKNTVYKWWKKAGEEL